MLEKKHPKAGTRSTDERPNVFDRMAAAGASRYCRSRELPGLVALWPHELADVTANGRLQILSKLRRALRAERRRARAGHWSYDLNRHLALLSAYKGELALLRAASVLNRNAPGAEKPGFAVGAVDRRAKDSR